jgi:hypothetical protein
MRIGVAHHFGWAVAVTASADYKVVDRRRVELIEPVFPVAPIHHEGGPHLIHRSADPLDDTALTSLVRVVVWTIDFESAPEVSEVVASILKDAIAAGLDGMEFDLQRRSA